MKPASPTSTATYLLLLLAFVLGFLAIWADPAGSTASEEVSVGALLARPGNYWGRGVRIVGSVRAVEAASYILTDRAGESLTIRTARPPRQGADVLVIAMVGQDPQNALRPLLAELDRDSLRRSLVSVLLAVGMVLLASFAGIVLVLRADRRLRRARAGPAFGPQPEYMAPVVLRLLVVQGPDQGKSFEFDQPEVTIGRPGERANNVSLSDLTISRAQGRILRQSAGFILENESATNPTRLNGQAIQRSELLDGDRLEMGESVLKASFAPRHEVVS